MSAEDARARFADATRRHLTSPLADDVALQHVDGAAWHAAADALWEGTMDRPGLALGPLFTPEEAAAIADLDSIVAGRLEHRLLLVDPAGAVVGAYWGQQETFGRYYMTVSVLAPAWRGRGLYRALLARVTAAVADAGFRELYSRHRADNNEILIPKLRAGWTIAAFEVTPRFGLLVHLRRYLVDAVRLVHEHRVDGAHAAELRARGLKLP